MTNPIPQKFVDAMKNHAPRTRFVDDLKAWAEWRTLSRYPNFTPAEFNCRCDKCNGETGAQYMAVETLDAIQRARDSCGFPFIVSSGYRCPNHPKESEKTKPGAHNRGVAVDIQIFGKEALILLAYALGDSALADDRSVSFRRIGVNQKDGFSSRFLHLQILDKSQSGFWVFSY